MATYVFIGLSIIGMLSLAYTYFAELIDPHSSQYHRVKGALGGLACIGLGVLLIWALFTQPVEKENPIVSTAQSTVVASK